MHTPFSTRITVNFGALFLAAMAILLSLWYWGMPQIGLEGAGSQRLAEASRMLELSADHQQQAIERALNERRGDVLNLAQDGLLSRQLVGTNAVLQRSFLRVTKRMMEAYPERYLSFRIVDPATMQIRAASAGVATGGRFADAERIIRASMPGISDLVEQMPGPEGITLVVIRKMHTANAQGDRTDSVGGILIAVLNPGIFTHNGTHRELALGQLQGATLLLDSAGQLLATANANKAISFAMSRQVPAGFEGTLQKSDERGNLYIVVYRSLALSGTQAWTLVHYQSRDEAFAGLIESANKLAYVALLLTALALMVIGLAARRLATPLQVLARTAHQLERGDLSARASPPARAGKEIVLLSDAFNAMADSIEKGHQTLQQRVAERSAELLRSQARHRAFFESTADAVLVLRQESIIDCNAAALKMFGTSQRSDLVGHMPSEFSPELQANGETSRDAARGRFDDAVRPGSLGFEWIHRRVDTGDSFFCEVLLSHVEIDGTALIQATVRDVSLRKQSEQALRIAAIAFESQEGLYVCDAQWNILRVNHAFTRITGYTSADAVGRIPMQLLGSGHHNGAFFSAMAESLRTKGNWQGEVIDRRKDGATFPAWMMTTAVLGEDGAVSHYVSSMTDFTARKAAEEEIRNLAFYDPLTNLPNRRLLMDRLHLTLSASARHAHHGALLFIDLDNFKALNDTRGHDLGDLLLQQVAQRLVTCVREGDTVARLGGDEFVVMLQNLSEDLREATLQTETVGEKILSTLNHDYTLAGQTHHSTPSIGCALFAGQKQTIDELLKRADLAMYQAKAAGRNTLRFFDPAMQTAVSNRAAMETGLREAVILQQFILHYQAQVAGDERVTGAEALVRWQHPQRGMVSPSEFIALSEETGVIYALGNWVLEAACKQLVAWANVPRMAHLTVAVNVSVRQFNHRDFVAQVLEVLEVTGANPRRLKLELTESLLASNVDDIVAKMTALKARGVQFSLDDFGTGYSSLSYLKRMPLDQLKIDQGFVRDILLDPNDAAIAKMVIALADSLGLSVIAEGVETEAQRKYLARQGCDACQGYLFSRPLPVQEFEAFAAQH